MLHSFWFHKSYKYCKSCKKMNVKELSVLFIRLKKNFFQFIFIYIYILYISIYINSKNNAKFWVLLQKNETFSHSFTFFAKERCVLCVLLGLISRQKLKKRTEKNVAFFKRTEKNGTFRTEKNAVPNPGCEYSIKKANLMKQHTNLTKWESYILYHTYAS